MSNKDQALEAALKEISKTYGKNAIAKIGDMHFDEVPTLPTGIPELDRIFGVNGIPKGRIMEIFGLESSGKSVMTLLIAAAIQKNGGRVALVDAEGSYDPKWSGSLGVDSKNLYLVQVDSAEEYFGVIETMVSSCAFDLIIVDSVDALIPQNELNEELTEEARMGLKAKLMSRCLRRLNNLLSKHKTTTVIFINQLRQKIGIVFGNPHVTGGGLALKFYSSLRLEVRKESKSDVIENGVAVGHKVHVKVVKNKVGPPLGEASFPIRYGNGSPNSSPVEVEIILDENSGPEEILAAAIIKGIVVKDKSIHIYNDKKYYMKRKILEDVDLITELRGKVNGKKQEEVL